MQSKAVTVDKYLQELPVERRSAIETVRKLIKSHLQMGYEEVMQYGMITYVIPLSKYPKGYGDNKKVPLPFISLASQKNYMSIYMMNLYGNKEADKWFRQSYKESGKKLDMGKGCLRFKKVEDLALELIGKAVALTSVDEFISQYEKVRSK